MTRSFNCPNCGAQISPRLTSSKVAACDFCNSTVFLDDMSFRDPGAEGEVHDPAGLMQLHKPSIIMGRRLTPRGVVRYSYGRGVWDEFWCEVKFKTEKLSNGVKFPAPWGMEPRNPEGCWISVDEGDIVAQLEMEPGRAPAPRDWTPGDELQWDGDTFRAQEAEEAECIGFSGELPDRPKMGDKHRFVNFDGPNGRSLSVELETGEEPVWFMGRWVDPWKVAEGTDTEGGK